MNFLTAEVEVRVDDSKMTSQLAKAKSAVMRTVSAIKMSFSKMAASFKAAFDKMVRYAKWALLAIAALAIKSFASFDDAMTKSVAIMGDVSDRMRSKMEEVATKMSLRTTASATELAKAYFYLASAGLSAEQSLKALGAVERFATAGSFDLSAATEMAVGSQAALGLASKDAETNLKNLRRVTDNLVTANELSQATVSQFAESLANEAAAAMKVWNIELEEGVAILAAYAKQNIRGAEAGSAFGRMLRFMMMGARKNREEWERFGLALYDTQGNLRPLADVIKDMTSLLSGMSTEQKGVILDLLGFQARSQQVILPLLGMSDSIREWNERLVEAGGHTKELAEKNLKSFTAQMKIVWNNIVSVAKAMGERLAPDIQALGDAFKRNRDVIERWALTFVEYVLYAKNIIWSFVKFLWSDWKSGIKAGLDISIELFKGFGESLVILMTDIASRAWRAFVKEFGEGLGKWLFEIGRPEGILGKISMISPAIAAGRIGMMKAGVGLIEESRTSITPEGPSLGEKLKGVREKTMTSIKKIVPPELGTDFDEAAEKLKEGLEKIRSGGYAAAGYFEEMYELEKRFFLGPDSKPLEEALSNVAEAAEDAGNKIGDAYEPWTKGTFIDSMKQWSASAQDMWRNFSSVATNALNSTSDALADFVMKGKADFNSLAESILMDLTRMIIKAQMAQVLGVISPSWFGAEGAIPLGASGTAANPMVVTSVPSGQHGGEVTKTGLAVIHKGESLSGVNNENARHQSTTLNINVNAIDAAGTYQFLAKNKRAIANMLQSTLTGNHPLRRSRGWK